MNSSAPTLNDARPDTGGDQGLPSQSPCAYPASSYLE